MFGEMYSWIPLVAIATLILLILVTVGMYISKPSYDAVQENTGKYFWCCTRLAAMVLKEAFLMIYGELETDGGHMSIGNYCRLTGNKYPVYLFRNANEIEKLGKDPVADFLDVPFLCKVLTDVLPSCNVTIPHRLQRIAHELRARRNKVCHEDFSIDDDTLWREFHNFKEIFAAALREAGRITGTKVSGRIRCIEEEMDKALAGPPLKDNDIILTEVSEVRHERTGSAISVTRRSLISAIRDLKNTEAAIRFHCFSNDNTKFRSYVSEQDVNALPKLRTGQNRISIPKLLVTCFKSQDSNYTPVLILWSSDMGVRAVMLHYLMNEWATKSQTIYGLDSFDLVILIDGTENIRKTLDECKHPQLSFADRDTRSLLRETKVLLLLAELEPFSSLLQQFLCEFPQAYFIITAQPRERFKIEQECRRCQRQVALVQLIPRENSLTKTLGHLQMGL